MSEYFTPRQVQVIPPGRPAGARNRLSTSAKRMIQAIHEGIGGYDGYINWIKESKENEYAFRVMVYPKLLATEGRSLNDEAINIIIEGRNQHAQSQDAVIVESNACPENSCNKDSQTDTRDPA